MTSDLAEELERLVHALRQPLGAARLLTDDLARSSLGPDGTVHMELLATAIDEAIDVAHALAALAERAGREPDDLPRPDGDP